MNNNNYKIIRTIYENVFQRVLECKDNESNEIFYNNVITSQRVINLIDIGGLKDLSTNILECKKTEDRLYIITKPLEFEGKNIKEYIKDNKLTLKQQFSLSKNIIKLSSDIFNMTDIVQQKILDLDKLYIDSKGQFIIDCNLIFEQEFDISDNETFKRMGNIIHYIFSGNEIIDYNISELIPPDILKIIVRCLTKEYMYPQNALSELVSSPIYNMIYTDKEKEDKKAENTAKELSSGKNEKNEIKSRDNLLNMEIESEFAAADEKDTLDIYLNDNEIKKSKANKKIIGLNKDIKKMLFSIAVVISVLLIGNLLMNKINKGAKEVSGDDVTNIDIGKNTENDNTDINGNEGGNVGDPTGEANENTKDSTSKFFNKDLINKINYAGTLAEIDKDIYVEGVNSLLIKNESDEKVKALFAAIDFTDPDYSYLLKQQIGVSSKIKSENDLSALIVLEAYKDGKLASNFHTSVKIYNDVWSQNLVPINVTNADALNIYIEYSGKNKVWIDSIYIDVIK